MMLVCTMTFNSSSRLMILRFMTTTNSQIKVLYWIYVEEKYVEHSIGLYVVGPNVHLGF
jgi:hypothetical protein